MKRIMLVLLASFLITSMLQPLFNVSVTSYDEELREKYLTTVYATEEEKLETMVKYLTAGDFTLYIEEMTGEFALENSKTKKIIWSNPFNVSHLQITETQKCEMLSQILLKYATISTGESTSINSFEEAAIRNEPLANTNQIVIKPTESGVRAEYILGNNESKILVPRMIAKDRFEEEIIKPLKEAANNNLTTPDGQTAKFLLSKFINDDGKSVFYTLKDPNAPGITDRQRRAMYLYYPITKEMPVYIIDPSATQLEIVHWLEKAIVNFTDYTFEDMAYDHNLTKYVSADTPAFEIAIEYSLSEDGLTYCVSNDDIRFDSTLYKIDSLTVLPYLEENNSIHHINATGWLADSTHHWRECFDCGEIQKAKHTVSEGICTVCGKAFYTEGDVDDSSSVEAADAIHLLYYVFFGEARYPVNQNCDFDGNGTVEAADAIYLLYYIFFGAERYPLHPAQPPKPVLPAVLVTDAVNYECPIITDLDFVGDLYCEFYIPKLNYETENSKAFNEKIYNEFSKTYEFFKDYTENGGGSDPDKDDRIYYIGYDYKIYNNFVAIAVTQLEGPVAASVYVSKEKVYYYDCNKDKELTFEEYLNAFGYTKEEAESLLVTMEDKEFGNHIYIKSDSVLENCLIDSESTRVYFSNIRDDAEIMDYWPGDKDYIWSYEVDSIIKS